MSNKQSASLVDAFERALEVILARASVLAEGGQFWGADIANRREEKPIDSIAIAYSGGLDSSALLQLAQHYAATRGKELWAFHVHHGLSPNADDWARHCECECARLGVRIEVRRVSLAERGKDGIEQAARNSRYAALGQLCRLRRVSLLLTAHHLDDQAETVLLQMLRGSGVAGLGGMENANVAPGLLGDSQTVMARPLLGVPRSELERFVTSQNIRYVEDESNNDSRYARNALRHQVMSSLAAYFPGFQQRFARSAQHARAAQRLLDEVAAHDFAACRDSEYIVIDRLKQLSGDRIDNLMRYWFASNGVRMPAAAWLSEMREQLFDARDDAQVCVTHPDCEIRRHRGRIFLVPRYEMIASSESVVTFRWQGEPYIHFPEFDGSIHFEYAAKGIDGDWLLKQDLMIRLRTGGERLKLAHNRPTRSLKQHYQALNIPAWERLRLPVILAAGRLLFAAGVGMSRQDLPYDGGRGVMLRWERGTPRQ